MTQSKTYSDTDLRSFLLGEMPEDERIALEECFLTDEDLFDRIRVFEDELTENYVRGTLSVDERSAFENVFLVSDVRRERVAFTRQLLETTTTLAGLKKTAPENVSVWQSITNFFSRSKYAFAAILAILLLVLTGWFIARRISPGEDEVVRQTTPTPTTPPANIDNSNRAGVNDGINVSPNKNGSNKNATGNRNQENKNAVDVPVKQQIVTLALFAGTIRGNGKSNELVLSKQPTLINFELNLEAGGYKTYLVKIADPDGNVLLTSAPLIPRGGKLTMLLPAATFPNGDYIIKAIGITSDYRKEPAADFTFRLSRK